MTLHAAASSHIPISYDSDVSTDESSHEYNPVYPEPTYSPEINIAEIDALAERVFGPDVKPSISYGYRFYKNRKYQPNKFYNPSLHLANIVKKPAHTKRISRRKENKAILRGLTHMYKIHCMPHSISDFLYKLFDFLERNTEISKKISCIKYAVHPGQDTDITPTRSGYLNHPLIVIYVYGRNDAQEVLDQIYAAFKDEPGRGYQPRYNARVTDCIWVAQGHGDEKGSHLPDTNKILDPKIYWEQPNRIYFSEAVAKHLEIPLDSFYLRHPTTGAVLNGPASAPAVSHPPRRHGSLASGPSLAEVRKHDGTASSSEPRRQFRRASRSPHIETE